MLDVKVVTAFDVEGPEIHFRVVSDEWLKSHILQRVIMELPEFMIICEERRIQL
jgi:hypothetical protein